MFDGLLKSKFHCKCKSEIKLTMKRIEMIRRKRNAMQKFLTNDVADLLKTGLDCNAYDRIGQLYADQNLSWCYEFVEQSCLLILSQLSAMNKQRECPKECKEAVSTLMFAAARFADLPELRGLRSLFTERYGNCLEPYVNQQFVKNLKADPPTTCIKLQMMQEIALEYGINWDSSALVQKLYNPPPFVQDWSQYANDLETNIKKEAEEEKHKKPSIGKSLPYKSRAEIENKKEEQHDHGRLSPCWSSNTSISSESTTSADDNAFEDTYIKTKESTGTDDGLRSVVPPYTKPDLSKKTGVIVNDDNLKSENDISKQIPRSMWVRRPLKQAAGSSHGDNGVLETSSGVSDGENNIRDKEEKKMDKLLSHYSSKPSHAPPPIRTGSLPFEPVAAGGDERKGPARAVTFQLDSRGHVHPKLPDYEDFVARLAAFRATRIR